MLKRLYILAVFYKRILLSAIFFAGLFGLLGLGIAKQFSFTLFGMAYLLMAPASHLFIYEVLYRQEYYFYHNLGFSKLRLWVWSFLVSLTIAICLILI